MLENLKREVFLANKELVIQKLVIYTWGNVSGIDREKNLVVIKPSGISYDIMKEEDMVVVNLDGKVIEGNLNPSSDTPTHLELYKKYSQLGGIVHTHSQWATSWAQASRDIPCYGTTHSDYFYGAIPCTRKLREEEVKQNYELNTGKVIIETLELTKAKPLENPGVIVSKHGPFTWGKTPKEAVYHAKVLEEIAKIAYHTEKINPVIKDIDNYLLNKHYLRKHGKNAYYGQNAH